MNYSPTRNDVILVFCAIALLTNACVDTVETESVLAAVRTDSAGIEIVLHPSDAAVIPVFATLDSVATLRLGSLNGRPEEVFGTVDAVLPLADGGVAILDGLAAEIRIFDSAGAYRMSVGSKGNGPGELDRPRALTLLPGDTLAVYDARPMRITRFAPDGSLGRITTLNDARNRVVVAAFLPDGRLVGQSRWRAPGGQPPPQQEPTLVRDTVVLSLFTTEGALVDTIDVVPSMEGIVTIFVSDRSVSITKVPAVFGRTSVFTTHPEGVWSNANDRFELRLRDPVSGRLVRIIRAPGLERPATDEFAQAIYDSVLAEADSPDARRRADDWYKLSPRPEALPAYDQIVVDDHARLWVREWSRLNQRTRWWVFSASGNLLGSVQVPAGTTIASVRCGHVWGVEQDEFDVSYVVRYALNGVSGC